MGSCPAAGERGWKARGRRETADTDIASRSLFYEQDLRRPSSRTSRLPPLSRISTHGPVCPHTNTCSMHRLLTYACVSITPSSCFFVPRAPPRVVIADYVCRFPNEDRGKYVRMRIRTLDICAHVIAWISSGTNQNFLFPLSSTKNFRFSADGMKLLASIVLMYIHSERTVQLRVALERRKIR